MNEQLLALYKQALDIATNNQEYSSFKEELHKRANRVATGEATTSDTAYVKNFLELVKFDEDEKGNKENGKVLFKVTEVEKGRLIATGSLDNELAAHVIAEILKMMNRTSNNTLEVAFILDKVITEELEN